MVKRIITAMVAGLVVCLLAGCTAKQVDTISRDVNAVNGTTQQLVPIVAPVAGAANAGLGAILGLVGTIVATAAAVWQTIAKSGILTQLTLHQQALGAVVNAVAQTSPDVQAAVKTEVEKAMAGNKDVLNPIVDSVKA